MLESTRLQREAFRPVSPLFHSDIGVIELGYLGKPQNRDDADNPGSPDGDPDFREKLTALFGNQHLIIYPKNNHNGNIGVIMWTLHEPYLSVNGFTSPISNQIITPEVDAIVLSQPPSGQHLPRLVSRTWDCANVLIYCRSTNALAAVHLSVETLVGYHSDKAEKNFPGPILERLPTDILIPGKCIVSLGPAIGSNCRCYEFDIPDARRLLSLIEHWYPDLDLQELHIPRFNNGKFDILIDQITVKALEHWGVQRRLINRSCHFCTKCSSERFYSLRAANQQPTAQLAIQLTKRFGNLAFIYWSNLY